MVVDVSSGDRVSGVCEVVVMGVSSGGRVCGVGAVEVNIIVMLFIHPIIMFIITALYELH